MNVRYCRCKVFECYILHSENNRINQLKAQFADLLIYDKERIKFKLRHYSWPQLISYLHWNGYYQSFVWCLPTCFECILNAIFTFILMSFVCPCKVLWVALWLNCSIQIDLPCLVTLCLYVSCIQLNLADSLVFGFRHFMINNLVMINICHSVDFFCLW